MSNYLQATRTLLLRRHIAFRCKKQQSINKGKTCVKLRGNDHNCCRDSEKGQITRGVGGFSFTWHVKDTEDLDKQRENSIIARHPFSCPFLWLIIPVGLQVRRKRTM